MADAELLQQLLVDIQKTKTADEARIKQLKAEQAELESSLISVTSKTTETETRHNDLQKLLVPLKLEREVLRYQTADYKAAVIDPLVEKHAALVRENNESGGGGQKASTKPPLSATIVTTLRLMGAAEDAIQGLLSPSGRDSTAQQNFLLRYDPKEIFSSPLNLSKIQSEVEERLANLNSHLATRAKVEAEKALAELHNTDKQLSSRRGFNILSLTNRSYTSHINCRDSAGINKSDCPQSTPSLPSDAIVPPPNLVEVKGDLESYHLPFDCDLHLSDHDLDSGIVPERPKKKTISFKEALLENPSKLDTRPSTLKLTMTPTSVLAAVVATTTTIRPTDENHVKKSEARKNLCGKKRTLQHEAGEHSIKPSQPHSVSSRNSSHQKTIGGFNFYPPNDQLGFNKIKSVNESSSATPNTYLDGDVPYIFVEDTSNIANPLTQSTRLSLHSGLESSYIDTFISASDYKENIPPLDNSKKAIINSTSTKPSVYNPPLSSGLVSNQFVTNSTPSGIALVAQKPSVNKTEEVQRSSTFPFGSFGNRPRAKKTYLSFGNNSK